MKPFFLAGPAKILKGDAGRDPAGIFAGEFQGVVVRPAVLAFHPQQDHVDVIAVHGLDRAVGIGVLALEVTVAVGNDPPYGEAAVLFSTTAAGGVSVFFAPPHGFPVNSIQALR